MEMLQIFAKNNNKFQSLNWNLIFGILYLLLFFNISVLVLLVSSSESKDILNIYIYIYIILCTILLKNQPILTNLEPTNVDVVDTIFSDHTF